ncbi:hypothetical protein EOM39_07175 [Candidatus Gracilibacteria bacterium]|nr:hypothetical protein [Candidatus Gracilibacteria bacterium]
MKKIIKIIFTILILLLMFGLYVWGMSYLDWKKENAQVLQEVYTNLGENHQIGKYHKVNSICSKDEKIGCLNGEVKGIKIIDNKEYYLYVNLYTYETKGGKINEELKVLGYNYKLFYANKNIFVQKEQDIPKYGYLLNNELKFYSENDLSKLPQEQQIIFKELEKTPSIIIDGVDYTKK